MEDGAQSSLLFLLKWKLFFLKLPNTGCLYGYGHLTSEPQVNPINVYSEVSLIIVMSVRDSQIE